MPEIGLPAIRLASKNIDQFRLSSSSSSSPKDYTITLYSKSEVLLVSLTEVLWLKNDVLVRKIKYDNDDDRIVNAHLVHFNNTNFPNKPTTSTSRNSSGGTKNGGISKKKALAVILLNRAHMYFEDDETHFISFPFNIKKSLLFENGLILERQLPTNQDANPIISNPMLSSHVTSSKINFLTLLDPLSELGMVVSSSTSSFSPNEEMVWFPQSPKCSLAVTFNLSNHIIAIYHVRILAHSKNKPTHNGGVKRSSIRKRSLSRKSSVPNSAAVSSVNENDLNSMDDPAAQSATSNRTHARRSVSHSEMLSYDRMASNADVTGMDLNDTSSMNIGNSSANGPENIVFRKDMVLTKIEKVQFNYSTDKLKVFSLSFANKQGIAIVNKETKHTEVLIFKSSTNSVNLPSYQSSYNFKCLDALPLSSSSSSSFSLSSSSAGSLSSSSSDHGAYLIALQEDRSSIRLINPFLNLKSHDLNLQKIAKPIQSLDHCTDYSIALTDTDSKTHIIKLLVESQDELTKRCLQSLKYIFGPYAFEYIWLNWLSALTINSKGSEWQSFIVTLLSVLVPVGTDFSDLKVSNEVIDQLEKANLLNQSSKTNISERYQKSLNNMAPNAVLALHLLREDLKLNVLEHNANSRFDILLAQLVAWLGWSDFWIKYYIRDTNCLDLKTRFPVIEPLNMPPNLLKSLCSIFSDELTPYITFSQLSEENDIIDEIITPRTYYILRIFEAIVSPQFSATDVVNLMVEYGIDSFDLETYPIGISLPLKEYLSFCRNSASIDSSLRFINLLGRKDLEKYLKNEKSGQKSILYNPTVSKDVHQIIQSIKSDEPLSAWDGHSEADRLSITKLIFSTDRRFYEITRLLQSSKIQTVTMNAPHDINEYDLLKSQKQLSTLVALRTLTIPFGRGALFLSSRMPILTEKFPIPKLNFDTLIQPANTTLSLDKDSIDPDFIEWGYFHNGVSAGLTVLRSAENIAASWIVFNKPNGLNSQHGGFLLGLGLNGHLKNLEQWHLYNYLESKHTHTSVGLLLGISASARGSMDMNLTKVLSVHVVALLPQGATDLNVSLSVQTAGLVGIGLLYLETQHRRMSEILLSQISNKISYNDKMIVDEGYRLAAGIALGYVNLGKGNDLKGLNDTHITDRLLSMAVSLKDVQMSQEYDKSAPGAVIALGLIYIKTNNYNIASKLQVPQTEKLLDYVRPDLLSLRIVAKNLILWDNVLQTNDWVESQIPSCLLQKYSIDEIKYLDSDQLTYFNCLAGACTSMALKFASTGDLTARDVILFYLDHFIRITALPTTTFDERITQASAASIQDMLSLSVSIIMAGTGDLETFKRLRALHNRTNKTMTYANYAALSMALGFLFIASGEYAFDDSNFAIAALLTAIYPAQNNGSGNESQVYLQALRHFWVLSTQPRCLVARDVDTSRPVDLPIEIVLKNGEQLLLNAPCLLPRLANILSIRTLSDEYFEVYLNFEQNIEVYHTFIKSLTIHVYKKKEYQKSQDLFKSILENISNEFEQFKISQTDKACDIILKNTSEVANEHESLVDSLVTNSRFEISSMVKLPQNIDDLWNIKLIFAFYEKIKDVKTYYLSSDFVELLKIDLWKLSRKLRGQPST